MAKKLTSKKYKELFLEDPYQYKAVVLSDNQADIVNQIKELGSVDSAWLRELKGITRQNASAQLNSLYLKGYLGRKEVPDPTGGTKYHYFYKLT